MSNDLIINSKGECRYTNSSTDWTGNCTVRKSDTQATHKRHTETGVKDLIHKVLRDIKKMRK
jgi:hypothetical protein